MSDLLNQIEAILFSTGKKVEVEYIRKLCKVKDIKLIKEALEELTRVYDARQCSLQVVSEGEFWKLAVRDAYVHLVRKIVPETEMTKSVMETLAVVAWKQPIMQAEVIHIRTNKAYEHIKELINMGFVTSEKCGRTKKLKLTQKFLDYFDLRGIEDIRELFKEMKAKEKAPEDQSKAGEVARLVEGIKQAVEEQNIVSQAIETEETLGKLEVYESEEPKPQEKEQVEFTSEKELEERKEVSEMLDEALHIEEPEEKKDEDASPIVLHSLTGLKDSEESKESTKPSTEKKEENIDKLFEE